MIDKIKKNEWVIGFVGLVFAIISFFFADNKLIALIIFVVTIFAVVILCWLNNRKPKEFCDVQKIAKILFIDDKDCQIVINLQRNNFDVKKIDDVEFPATNNDVQWANIIFVDYKGVGKKTFEKKEGLGLINELKRVYGNKKRYVIYSTVQDFGGLTGFPYIRKNATYDEYISLITTEVSKL